MAFASVGTLGSIQSTTANQTTLVLTTSATLNVDNVGVLIYAVDNNQTTDGDEQAATTVTDSAGNLWSKGREQTNGQGTAQAGTTCGIWFTKARTQLTSGGTITITWQAGTTASRDASAATAWEFTIGANLVPGVVATGASVTDGATTVGSLNVTTPNVACLRIRGFSYENGLANNAATVTATWTGFTKQGNATGSAASQTVWGEHLINTATSAASAPGTASTSADWASVYISLIETDTLLGQAVL